MIELVVLDIDGVITDGSVIIDSRGIEQKQINLKDIDAIFELHRRGYKLIAITGEDTEIVNYFEKRFPWEHFYRGNKAKKETVQQIESEMGIGKDNICYVGDGKYDVELLEYAGLGICPANAIDKAKDAADIILQNEGGKGCIWELISILEKYGKDGCAYAHFYKRLEEHSNILKKIASDQELIATVMKIGDRIIDILKNKGTIYLCGNGGSAADAQHIAAEFVGRFYQERKGLSAEALTVNTSILTGISNDYSFERVFVRQLEAKAHAGDMLIGISTSGTSKNILEALHFAKENGIISVLMTGEGFETSMFSNVADYIVKVPSLITPRIQEAHIFIGHVIAEYVEYEMFKEE